MNTITEHRSCQCEDRPCCGCDNGTFELENESRPDDDSDELEDWTPDMD